MDINSKKKFVELMENEIQEMVDAMGDESEDRDKFDEYMDGVLSIDETRTFTILLAFGGPGYGFDIHTRQGELYYVEFWYAWGQDHFTERLTDDEANIVWDAFSPYIETELQ